MTCSYTYALKYSISPDVHSRSHLTCESEWLERYERLQQIRSLNHWRPGVVRHVGLRKDYRTAARRHISAMTETCKRQCRHDARRVNDTERTCACFGVSRAPL
eukprot:4761952-Pleurochrysis_carterae.AAC.1